MFRKFFGIRDRYLRRDSNIEEFIFFNREKLRNSELQNGVALFEMGYFHPLFIVYHYLAKFCNEEGLLKLAYNPDNSAGYRSRFTQRIFCFLSIDSGTVYPQRILRSLGINKFIVAPKLDSSNLAYTELVKYLYSGNKSQILRMCYQGIRVGDLFYDWYLSRNGKATLDFTDKNLYRDFRMFCSNLNFWLRYFDDNDVKYVFVSHAVYVQGIMARIGLSRGAKVFLVGDERFNQLSLDNYFQDTEHKFYSPSAKELFDYKIDLTRSSSALAALETGSLDVDEAHRFVSGFQGNSFTKIVKSEASVRVLIAAHCFSDSIHAFGDMHVVDFWEWLEVISEAALKNPKYEWYIKAHPAFTERDQELFYEFTKSHPHFIVIDASYSIQELFKQGINVVLTVFGTIAFDAAICEKLVINCSPSTPHMNYSFVKKPKNLEDFVKILSQLETMVSEHTVNKNEILHFYDLHHLRKGHSWLYKQYRTEMIEYIGGYGKYFTNSRTLKYWTSNFTSQSRIESVMSILRDFIKSNDYLIPIKKEYTN